ncbi:MAG: hypothetical protein AAF663_09700 [Planctomycetota bacterium]
MTRTNPSKTRIARMTGLTLVAGLIAGPACAVSVPYFQDFESFPGSPDPDLRIENEGGIGSGDNAFGWILFPDVANPLDDPANPDDDLNNAYGLFLQSPDETLFNSGSLEIDVADLAAEDVLLDSRVNIVLPRRYQSLFGWTMKSLRNFADRLTL